MAAVTACDEPEFPVASAVVTTYTPECVIDIPALTAATARAGVKYSFEPSARSSVSWLERSRFTPVAFATRASALVSVKYRFVEPSVISSVLSFPATAVEIADVYAEVIAVSRVSVYALASTSA